MLILICLIFKLWIISANWGSSLALFWILILPSSQILQIFCWFPAIYIESLIIRLIKESAWIIKILIRLLRIDYYLIFIKWRLTFLMYYINIFNVNEITSIFRTKVWKFYRWCLKLFLISINLEINLTWYSHLILCQSQILLTLLFFLLIN